MKKGKRSCYFITILISALSAVFWLLLLWNPGDMMTITHCQITGNRHSHVSFQMFLAMNSVSDLMLGWIMMVLAMMLPKLIVPIQYIYDRSLKRRRLGSAVLFVLGYTITWAVAGFVINVLILGLNLLFPMSYIPALVVAFIVVVWQFSPVKQRFLNRGHNHWSLAAFGWAASLDAFRFGVMHGVWCIGSGWALMLFPMLLPEGHNLAMIIIAFIMISEHMEHPRLPRWYFNFRLKLFRIMIFQTKIRIKQLIATK